MKNPKAKGSGFERDLAKQIVAAFKEFGVEQRECWRSVLSGGHEISAGDLQLSERLIKLFPYALEAKFRRSVDWRNFLLHNEKSEELSWVRQTLDGAGKRVGLFPLLVIKENNRGVVAMFPAEMAWTKRGPVVRVYGQDWKVWLWKEFLEKAVKDAKGKQDETQD